MTFQFTLFTPVDESFLIISYLKSISPVSDQK